MPDALGRMLQQIEPGAAEAYQGAGPMLRTRLDAWLWTPEIKARFCAQCSPSVLVDNHRNHHDENH